MRTVHFGDLDVSAIGLGCMSMTGSYGISDRDEAAATLARAVELGVTLFDTANTYGAGENEELVGRVLAPHREHIVLATKFGFRVKRGGTPSIDGRPDQVEERCDESSSHRSPVPAAASGSNRTLPPPTSPSLPTPSPALTRSSLPNASPASGTPSAG